MKQIETKVCIKASSQKVWEVLTSFEEYPHWNPFIKSLKGKGVEGEQIEVQIQPPGGKGMTFKPIVLCFNPGITFRWRGKLGVRGIFDGEHYFILKEVGNGETELTHGEQFSGILIPLMGKALNKTKQGFELMNQALKKRCEDN